MSEKMDLPARFRQSLFISLQHFFAKSGILASVVKLSVFDNKCSTRDIKSTERALS